MRSFQQERLRAEFLGMVSHELRTPLAAIKGSVDTLLEAASELDAATGKCHLGGEVLWRLRPHVALAPDPTTGAPWKRWPGRMVPWA